MKTWSLIFCLTGALAFQLPAQIKLHVQPKMEAANSFSPSSSNSPSIFQPSSVLIPNYVRLNPRGYSYLCRLELEIEEKSPVGMWVKIGENTAQFEGLPRSNAYVRFKLFQF